MVGSVSHIEDGGRTGGIDGDALGRIHASITTEVRIDVGDEQLFRGSGGCMSDDTRGAGVQHDRSLCEYIARNGKHRKYEELKRSHGIQEFIPNELTRFDPGGGLFDRVFDTLDN